MSLRTLMTGLAVTLLFASCTSGTTGIFAGLEVEQKIVSTGGLSTTASVSHMAESEPFSKYFITGGQSLFAKAYSATVWTKTTIPGIPDYTVYAVGATGGSTTSGMLDTTNYGKYVWVVQGSQSDSNYPPTLYGSADGGSTWAKIALSGGETPIDLVPIRLALDGYSTTELIVVTQVSLNSGYNVNHFYFISAATSGSTTYTTTSGTSASLPAVAGPFTLTTPADTSGSLGLSSPIISAVNTGVTTSTSEAPYYFASQTYLWPWTGPTTSSSSFNTTTTTPLAFSISSGPSTDYGGIFYYPSGTSGILYLGTVRHSGTNTGGGLYYVAGTSLAATTVSFNTAKTNAENSSGYPVSFGQWIYNSTNADFWIGTGASTTYEGTGYMEFTPGSNSLATTPNTNSSNYSSSLLYEYAVGMLFRAYNGGSGLYYLGTLAHGLWYWNESGNSSNPWTQD